jgi:hypothetical protein
MSKKDLTNMGLPKWPAMVVVGKDVTLNQAKEILIRTDSFYLSGNDREFELELKNYMYNINIDKSIGVWNVEDKAIAKVLGIDPEDKMSWSKTWDYKELKQKEVGYISLGYLNNSRIISSWVGGPHGWCNWDGKIQCGNYNIGKWPSAEDVYQEWKSIAEAFPFLELKCQLFNGEASEEFEDGSSPKPVVQFNIKNGKVRVYKPKKALVQPDFADGFMKGIFTQGRERGCTLEDFKEAVDFCRNKFAKKSLLIEDMQKKQ